MIQISVTVTILREYRLRLTVQVCNVVSMIERSAVCQYLTGLDIVHSKKLYCSQPMSKFTPSNRCEICVDFY